MKAIITKYHGPTDTRGSRYSASDMDGNRIIQSANYALDSNENHISAALALCNKMGWPGKLVSGSLRNDMVHVFVS